MIVSWTIINNEIDFIKDVVKHHDWVDRMYFLDTGSTDGTLEYLNSVASDRIIVERYKDSFTPDYSVEWRDMQNPFPEVDVRNFALARAKELFGNCWLIQLDGDEVFLRKTKDIINDNKLFSVIGHSTINPVCKLEHHPIEKRGGYQLYDVHARIWKSNQWIVFKNNPVYKDKQYHCIPVFNNSAHIYYHPKIRFIPDPIHYHLHWMYGVKVEQYYKKTNVTLKSEIAKDQCENEYSRLLPNDFWDRREIWIKE